MGGPGVMGGPPVPMGPNALMESEYTIFVIYSMPVSMCLLSYFSRHDISLDLIFIFFSFFSISTGGRQEQSAFTR
jgi:hypothetical protein